MELTRDEQLAQIEAVIGVSKEKIALRDAMLRLFNNTDFKTVIEQGFFNDFARNLAHTVGNPGASAEMRDEVVRDLQAFGVLKGFFAQVRHEGQQAEQAIVDHENAREEIHREELEN